MNARKVTLHRGVEARGPCLFLRALIFLALILILVSGISRVSLSPDGTEAVAQEKQDSTQQAKTPASTAQEGASDSAPKQSASSKETASGGQESNSKGNGIDLAISMPVFYLGVFIFLFLLAIVTVCLAAMRWRQAKVPEQVFHDLQGLLEGLSSKVDMLNQQTLGLTKAIDASGAFPQGPPQDSEEKKKRERKMEEGKAEHKPEIAPPDFEETIETSVTRYNKALLSDDARERFLLKFEPTKVALIDSEEISKGEYKTPGFLPKFRENPQGDFLLAEIADKLLLYPNFYLDEYHYYNVKACFDLEKNSVVSSGRKLMIHELKQPAICEKESSGTWKLRERGKVVIQT